MLAMSWPQRKKDPKLLADFRVALGMWKHAAEQENREAQKSLWLD
jgi:hypothetical protein